MKSWWQSSQCFRTTSSHILSMHMLVHAKHLNLSCWFYLYEQYNIMLLYRVSSSLFYFLDILYKILYPHCLFIQLKIRNDFDPVLSPESSLFVLKSNKQVILINLQLPFPALFFYSCLQSNVYSIRIHFSPLLGSF